MEVEEDMTDPPNTKADRPKDDKDFFLQTLVSMAEKGLSMGITLHVGGLLVSGQMVSRKDYFAAFSSEFVSALPTTFDAQTRESIADSLGLPGRDEPAAAAASRGYVHLDDARVFVPGAQPIPTSRGVRWRGRLSEVAGFWLGKLSSE